MKLSRLHTMLGGIAIMIAGIGMFLDALGIISFNIFSLWPLILVYFGLKNWSTGKRLSGGILTGLGTLFLLQIWFNMDFENVVGLIISLLLIYVGFRLLRSRGQRFPFPPPDTERPEQEETADPSFARHYAKWAQTDPFERWKPGMDAPGYHGHRFSYKNSRSALIGDFHLTSGRFELTRMFIWHGIGNVVIDLSRAVIQEEEAAIVIKGWVGDITVYVPVDLPIAVEAEVNVGDLAVFGHHQGGLNRHVTMRSDSFDEAPKKVTLNISLLLGDIDVKYI